MKTKKPVILSKSRYMSGLQCLKRLYLEVFNRELMPPITQAQQALFDSGNRVGELARELYPSGQLVTENHFDHERAVKKTQELIDGDASIPIFEAGFIFDQVRTRVDILKPSNTGGFSLIEVKSSTKVKPEHIADAAIQVYVAEGSGLNVDGTYLAHINNSYVYQGGPYDLGQLFQIEEISTKVRDYISSELPARLSVIKAAVAQENVPQVEIGRHCKRPYECPFIQHCRKGFPVHHVEQLPGIRAQLVETLQVAGISDIGRIPSEFPGLNKTQERVRDSVVQDLAYVGPELAEALSQPEYPLYFLDFETFYPGLPVYPGTRPYQVIAFQWSLHIMESNGSVTHHSYLHTGSDDPRLAFVESLIESAGKTGTIIVFSSYEQTILKQLAQEYPDRAEELLTLCGRIFDLLKPIRASYYHPEFHGSFSLKAVLPVLVPELGYGDLAIQEGTVASRAYTQMIDESTDEKERNNIKGALLNYCERDTEAMLKIWSALKGL